ncbi:MAG: hypothetical protein U0R78_14635 [Nocardioidaceae bacterium]
MTKSITLDKQAGTPSGATAGLSTIVYSFVVQNTGNVTLTSVGVNDLVGTLSCPATSLAPGGRRPAPRPTRSPRPTLTPAMSPTTPRRRARPPRVLR